MLVREGGGAASRGRTGDLPCTRRLLCLLSYGGAWGWHGRRESNPRCAVLETGVFPVSTTPIACAWYCLVESNHRHPAYETGALAN